MAKLGSLLFLLLIQLFILKVVCTGLLPIFKTDQQVCVLEESQENEESDDNYEFKFLDEYFEWTHLTTLHQSFHFNQFNELDTYFNAQLVLGFHNQSFKPPCD
ncbi:MAG: hypothetical protein RL511_1050 [Bacteroidota bacterium]|jgi:hypothetical protein